MHTVLAHGASESRVHGLVFLVNVFLGGLMRFRHLGCRTRIWCLEMFCGGRRV